MEETKKIYIGNLDYGATEADVKRMLIEKELVATEVTVISDRLTGRSKGFGFAQFETEEETQKAISALSGQELNGRTLNVSKANKPKPRSNGFGAPRRNNFGGGYGRGSRY